MTRISFGIFSNACFFFTVQSSFKHIVIISWGIYMNVFWSYLPHTFPPNSSQICLLPTTPPYFMSFFLSSPSASLCTAHVLMGVGLSIGMRLTSTRSPTLKENSTESSSPRNCQLLIASSGGPWAPSSSLLECWPFCPHAGLVWVVNDKCCDVTSAIVPLCPEDTFWPGPPRPLALQILAPLRWWSLSFAERDPFCLSTL